MNREKHQTDQMVLAALAGALIYISTVFLKIPNGLQGYFNAGDTFILLFAGVLPPGLSGFAAGMASALADLTGGYPMYAAATLLIKGLEGWAVSFLTHKYGHVFSAWILGLVILVGGYFLFEWFLFHSLALACSAALVNLVQAGFCFGLAVLLRPVLARLR